MSKQQDGYTHHGKCMRPFIYVSYAAENINEILFVFKNKTVAFNVFNN